MVRKYSDTDSSPQVIEQHLVSLDPDAENYILKVIGDRYT
jgi:hypothetical protein